VKLFRRLLLACLFPAILASAQTATVSGQMNLPPGTPAYGSFMRFQLVYCGSGKASVQTASMLVNFASFDIQTNSTGGWSTPLYGNNQIVCGSTLGLSAWRITPYMQGIAGQSVTYVVGSGQNFVADTAPPCSATVTFSCTVTSAPVAPSTTPIPVLQNPTGVQTISGFDLNLGPAATTGSANSVRLGFQYYPFPATGVLTTVALYSDESGSLIWTGPNITLGPTGPTTSPSKALVFETTTTGGNGLVGQLFQDQNGGLRFNPDPSAPGGGMSMASLFLADANGNYAGGSECADGTQGTGLLSSQSCMNTGALTVAPTAGSSHSIRFPFVFTNGNRYDGNISFDQFGDFVVFPEGGASHGGLTLPSATFANLPVGGPLGTLVYCSDCKNVSQDAAAAGANCAGGGHGSVARREGSTTAVWDCN